MLQPRLERRSILSQVKSAEMGVALTANLSLCRPSVEFGELEGDFARPPRAIPFTRGP